MTIDQIFKAAVEKKASDVHLYVGRPPVIRVHGELEDLAKNEVLTKSKTEALILSILSAAQKEKFIGLDDPDKPESKERNKKHRRDMLEYVENLFKQCEDVVKPWGKLAVFLYSRAKNRGVPEWYGRVEDIQPAFRAQLTAIAESGYKGQWEAFQREIEKTI